MFTRKPPQEDSELDKVITELLSEILETRAEDKAYPIMVAQLTALYKLKEQDAPKLISADTKATIAANLIGIAMILGHEQAHVVTSKALSFVTKLR